MNVFEFLGLDVNHRGSNKVVQLVKNIKEVPQNKICYPLIAQIKVDGVFAMMVVHQGKAAIFGRTGKQLSNTSRLVSDFMENEVMDGVYIAELWSSICSLERLSGVVNPNRTNTLIDDDIVDTFFMSYHDYLTIDEFVQGYSNKVYAQRHGYLKDILQDEVILDYEYVHSFNDAMDFASELIGEGYEGAVFKDISAGYTAGHKGSNAMKIVRGVDFDLRCIGYEEGKGKYSGKISNLLFEFTNRLTEEPDVIKAMLGKGWSHKDAEEMLWNAVENTIDSPVGAIFQVTGLQISSKGLIRLPKVGEKRYDKEEED